jgi:hypothetical protein
MDNSCKTEQGSITIKERMKTWLFWKSFVFAGAGALGGFLYYRFVGCSSGSCAITSNPWASMLFGGFIGFYVVNRPCSC